MSTQFVPKSIASDISDFIRYLSQDISNLKEKPYLKPAITSYCRYHFQDRFSGLSTLQYRQVVDNYFKSLT